MDLIKDIFNNQIAVKSGCHDREHQVLNMIRGVLHTHHWQRKSEHEWHRGLQRIFLRLVDSITDVIDLDATTPRDLIITDNHISRPVNARVIQLPPSWFGIYYHVPQSMTHDETRDYSFLINRVDASRIRLLLALHKRRHLHHGWINFNCVLPENWNQHTNLIARSNWEKHYMCLGQGVRDAYQGEYQRLAPLMPFRNHALSHDQALQNSKINLVVETYHHDDVIAMGEKIFAAMCVPRPWMLFGGRFSIILLRNLGFDVLDDVIDHSYDQLTLVQDKYNKFVDISIANTLDVPADRLEQAAANNQQRLANLRDQWPRDFSDWLTSLDKTLSIT